MCLTILYLKLYWLSLVVKKIHRKYQYILHSNLKSLIEVHGTEIRITLKIKKKSNKKHLHTCKEKEMKINLANQAQLTKEIQ